MLQQAPAQGKFALERLTREVSSEYFPTSVEEAAETLSVGPLRRPRESLVSNFIIVLFKWVVGDDLGYKAHARIMSALEATHQLHPQIFAGVLRDKVNVIVRKVEDENLLRVLRVVFRIQEVWEHLASDVQNRLENYVSHLPDLYHLDEALDFPPLAKQARVRLRLASVKELNDCLFFSLHELIAEKFIDHYLAAKNYAEANERAKPLNLYADDLSESQQRRIIAGIDANDQIRDSFEARPLILAFRKTNKIEQIEFDQLLSALGLQKFVSTAAEGAT